VGHRVVKSRRPVRGTPVTGRIGIRPSGRNEAHYAGGGRRTVGRRPGGAGFQRRWCRPGVDRGRVGEQQEHGGVGQRSQRQADHGEGVQRGRTPVRPGRRLTNAQFTTPQRIRSRRRCPTCWASVRTMASPRSPVGSGPCRTRGRRRTDCRSEDCAARASRAGSEVFGDQSTSANGTSVTRSDHAGVVPRSIRAGRPDPGLGCPSPRDGPPACRPGCCVAPLTDHLLGCRIRATRSRGAR